MRPRSRHYQAAPVGETCPDIDDTQEHVDGAIAFLESIEWGNDDDGKALAKAAKAQVDALNTVRFEKLEELRKANQSLREWGAQKEADLEEQEDNAKRDLEEKEEEISKLEREVTSFEKTIEELESERDDLQSQIENIGEGLAS